MKHKKFKQSMAFVAAALIACQPVAASAANFADMNQVPWPGAEASINKAADLGLVVGETKNGKTYFRPRDSVSLAESCQLAYKLLLQTGKASADAKVTEKWSTVMNIYGIQEWAYPAVSFCLEKGIISISNLSSFMKNGSNLPATREQAATILGRALTTGVPSYSANAITTKFNDNASISSEAKPYVALLNQVGVVNGDNVGKFNPKITLNRTETAVMVTNLHGVLQKATTPITPTNPTTSTQSGTVNDMNIRYVNFKDSNAYYLYSSTGTTVTVNGESSSIDALVNLFKENKTITATVTLDSNYRVTKLVATYEEEKKEEKATKGALTKVKYDEEDDDGYIVIEKNSTYKIDDADDVDIEIDKKEYDLEELYDLFTKCEKDKETIQVEVTLNSKGKLTKIKGTIEDSSSDSVKGEVSKVNYDEDDEEGYIQIKGKSTKYYVKDTEKVTVTIDSKSKDYEDFYDLYDDDKYLYVTLTLDSKDYVTKIVASTKKSSSKDDADGKVSSMTYDEKKDKGTIKIGSKTYNAPDTDDVDIDITDGTTTIDDWKELYDAYKDKKTIEVTVELDDDEVTKIKGKVTEAKGLLKSFSSNSLTIEGKYSDTNYKYKFDNDEDEMEDVDVDIDGMSSVDNLLELMDWLDDFDKNEDELDLVLKLDKNGYITDITGELD